MDEINAVNNVSDGFTETDIDFVNFIVITVFNKMYGNGGHSIDLVKIQKTDKLIVFE